jgi:hypothetical protein
LTCIGCEQKTHTKSLRVGDEGGGVWLAAVRRSNTLLYAFVWPSGLPKTDTNDASLKPRPSGIHFLYTSPDGLWFNGEKIAIPKQDSPVLALRADGKVIPVTLTPAEWNELAELTDLKNKAEGISQGTLRDKLVSPLLADAALEK